MHRACISHPPSEKDSKQEPSKEFTSLARSLKIEAVANCEDDELDHKMLVEARMNMWRRDGVNPYNYEADKSVFSEWANNTIEIPVVFHVYSKINGIEANDKVAFHEHLQFMIDRVNKDYNGCSPEFDNADFNRHNLFSMVKNPFNACKNRQIYKDMLTRARSANIKYVINYEQCNYDPLWKGLEKATRSELKDAADTSSPNFRTVMDKYVKFKFITKNKKTTKVSTAYSPLTTCNIWIINFLDQDLAGYSTFPNDKIAGTGNDGLILSANVCQRDSSKMNSQINLWKTLSHELGHWCGASHPFDPNGDNANDIPMQSVCYGDMYSLFKWPVAPNGEPENINNIMGYQADCNTFMFTHDQVVHMRSSLLKYRPKCCHLIPSYTCDTNNDGFKDSTPVLPVYTSYRNLPSMAQIGDGSESQANISSVAKKSMIPCGWLASVKGMFSKRGFC